MAAITFPGSPVLVEQATGSTLTIGVPAGAVVGEILIAQVATSSNTVATPAGWILAAQANEASAPVSSSLYYRVVTGTEAANYVWTGIGATRTTGIMQRLAGVDTTTPLDVAARTATTGVATSLTIPGISTVTSDALLLSGTALNAGPSTMLVIPTGMTQHITSGSTGRRTTLAYETRVSPGATGSRIWGENPNTTTLQFAGWLAAFRPAVPGSGAPLTSLMNRWVGIPTPTGFTVSAKTVTAQSVRLKVGTDAAVTQNVVYSGSVTPDAAGWSKLAISGLSSATQYYYAIEMTPTGGGAAILSTEIGKAKTLPNINMPANFTFAFGSCLASGSAAGAAFNNLLARNPDLFLHLGDFHYADSFSTNQSTHRQQLEDQMTINTGLQNALANIPSYYVKSDHDAGGGNDAGPGAWTPANRAAHLQVVPTPSLVNPDGLYYSVVVGRVRLIFTDTRYLRSQPTDADTAAKSILGVDQKAWFKNELLQPEPLKIWVQDAPYVTTSASGDSWGNYNTERVELKNFIEENDAYIKQLITVHGDMHALGGDDGTNNLWGGFPSFSAAPFDQMSSVKGGPWSTGTYPAAGTPNTRQYGFVQITDNGDQITAQFTGYDTLNVSRVTLSVMTNEQYVPDLLVDKWDGSTLIRQKVERWNGTALISQAVEE